VSELEAVDDLYDWSGFDRALSRRPSPVRSTRRGSLVLAAALWAVDDVVVGEKRREPVIEEVRMPAPDPTQRVVVRIVWGEPRLSSATVRW
jgi:hypothetical protein